MVIPVGPDKAYRKYLQECLDSLKIQSIAPGEVLLVDDMANLCSWGLNYGDLKYRVIKNPWRLGGAAAFNIGIAYAKNELIIMLGSDDKLQPWAVEDCIKTWNHYKDPLGFYYCDVEYSDGETQSCACNCAMVTKSLWKHTGGFPPESAVGAWDSILLSIMIGNKGHAGNIYRVVSDKPPFWYRRHDETVTARSGDLQGAIFNVRDTLTRNWRKPEWALS